MDVPGFRSVRRYQALSGGLKYCTLYRTESIATFESDVYRQRLAAQTEWSKRMLRAVHRAEQACRPHSKKLGRGYGGQLGRSQAFDPRRDPISIAKGARSGVRNLLIPVALSPSIFSRPCPDFPVR